MEEMFYECTSLIYTDISSFIIEKNISIFSELPDNCIIKVKKASYIYNLNIIPNTCEIISLENN